MAEQYTILPPSLARLTTEQQPLAVLQLFRREEPPDQHEGREPFQGKRTRVGRVSNAASIKLRAGLLRDEMRDVALLMDGLSILICGAIL
jgi:hypothetical protein